MKSYSMTPSKKTYPLRFAGTLLSLILIIYLFEKQGWKEVFFTINQISAWRFVAVLLLMVVSRVAVTLRWHSIFTISLNTRLMQGMAEVIKEWLGKLFRRLQQYRKNTLTILQYWINHPFSLIYAFLFSGLHMICLFTIISILLKGMHDPMPFWLIAGLWSVVYFITQIPLSINGYGLQEIALTLIFAQGGGISPQSSMSIALIMRALIMITSLPGALFLPMIISARKRE